MAEAMTGDEVVIAKARRDLRRVGIGLVVGVVVVLVARLVWGWHWANERRAAEEMLAKAGIPEGIEKVPVAKGATKEAAEDLVALIKSVGLKPLPGNQARYKDRGIWESLPATDEDIEFDRPFLAAQRGPLAGLLSLADLPWPDWTDERQALWGGRPGVRTTSAAFCNDLRNGAVELLAYAAREAGHDRDIPRLLKIASASDELVRRCGAMGTYIGWLTLVGIAAQPESIDLGTIPALAGMNRPDADVIGAIRDRIAGLLGSTGLAEVRGPIFIDEMLETLPLQFMGTGWLLAPAWDAARTIGYRSVADVGRENGQAHGGGVASAVERESSKVIEQLRPGYFFRSREVFWRLLTGRRIAATAWAIRLYRWDHGGRWPESLQLLVPEYLRSLPEGCGQWAGPLEICTMEDGRRPMLKTSGQDAGTSTLSGGPMLAEEGKPHSQAKVLWTDLAARATPP